MAAVSCQIVFSQDLITTPPGVALLGVITDPVTISNGNDSNVGQWTFEVIGAPPTSSLTIGIVQVGTIPTFTFIPDVPGGYLFRLTVQGSNGEIAQDLRVFQTPETSGRIIPPFKSTDDSLNFFIGITQNLSGWANTQGDYDRAIDILAPGSGISSLNGMTGPAVSIIGTDGVFAQPNVPTSNDLTLSFAIPSQSDGDLVVRDTGAWSRIAGGTLNQILTSQGPTVPPIWAPQLLDPSSGIVLLWHTSVSLIGAVNGTVIDTKVFDFSLLPGSFFPGPNSAFITQIFARVDGVLNPYSTSSATVSMGRTAGATTLLGTVTLFSNASILGHTVGHNTPSSLGSDFIVGTYIAPLADPFDQVWGRLTVSTSAPPITAGNMHFYGFGMAMHILWGV